MSISSLAAGTPAEITGLAEKVSAMTTKSNKPFVKLTIRDLTGSVDCVVWDCDLAHFPWLKDGAVVFAGGAVSTYQDKLQMSLDRIEQGQGSADDFAKRTKFDVETMWNDVTALIANMTEPLTKYVAEEIWMGHAGMIEALKKAPAARGVHNAWYSGLLEHVWSLTRLALTVVPHYQKNYCEKISLDKVIFGLMLHDAGKVIEYDYSNPAFNYTPLGCLTNHMVLGPAWVYEAANKWIKLPSGPNGQPESLMSQETFKLERAHLMHVLAAHHGLVEWGSPVKPSTIEAILVHHLDNLDSKVMHAMDYALGKPGPIKGFSERSYIEKVNYMQYGMGPF